MALPIFAPPCVSLSDWLSALLPVLPALGTAFFLKELKGLFAYSEEGEADEEVSPVVKKEGGGGASDAATATSSSSAQAGLDKSPKKEK